MGTDYYDNKNLLLRNLRWDDFLVNSLSRSKMAANTKSKNLLNGKKKSAEIWCLTYVPTFSNTPGNFFFFFLKETNYFVCV